jgi:lysozyme
MIMLPNDKTGKPILQEEKKNPIKEKIYNQADLNPILEADNTPIAPLFFPSLPLGNAERTSVNQLVTSEVGINLIKEFEGFRTNAYVDPGTKGEPITIGYGTTRYADGRKVKMGDTITEEQAAKELKHHVEKSSERDIRRFINVPLTQFEFDSLSSWTYNVGGGNLQDSTLRKKLNAQDYEGASSEFPRWNKAAGKVLEGLVKRRVAERTLYLTDNPGNIT